ncbi:hypothetical protein EDWATA_00564 [Edwardsiella tarda ATCC 23685]|uniref:Uncharacterized protein n=1 Tax=Edwardsiella tarda ATCC 23685 TaxID=500638 RepID=D4F1H4_EDWTA|nr:hypothetical protein EDWATA_00564 [Edwardsiella tarda ATCC 23685]
MNAVFVCFVEGPSPARHGRMARADADYPTPSWEARHDQFVIPILLIGDISR